MENDNDIELQTKPVLMYKGYKYEFVERTRTRMPKMEVILVILCLSYERLC